MRRPLRTAVPLLLAGALLAWISSRLTWVRVTAVNDQSGESVKDVVGAEWQAGVVALAVGAAAAVVGIALARGWAARLVGVIVFALGIGVGALAATATGTVDTAHAHAVVTASGQGATTSSGVQTGGGTVPEWSTVSAAEPQAAGPLLAGVGALAIVVAGLLLVVWPPRRQGADSRYEAPATREEKRSDAPTRSMWESIDAGDDPTV